MLVHPTLGLSPGAVWELTRDGNARRVQSGPFMAPLRLQQSHTPKDHIGVGPLFHFGITVFTLFLFFTSTFDYTSLFAALESGKTRLML